jgi:hypothetical protein
VEVVAAFWRYAVNWMDSPTGILGEPGSTTSAPFGGFVPPPPPPLLLPPPHAIITARLASAENVSATFATLANRITI